MIPNYETGNAVTVGWKHAKRCSKSSECPQTHNKRPRMTNTTTDRPRTGLSKVTMFVSSFFHVVATLAEPI